MTNDTSRQDPNGLSNKFEIRFLELGIDMWSFWERVWCEGKRDFNVSTLKIAGRLTSAKKNKYLFIYAAPLITFVILWNGDKV